MVDTTDTGLPQAVAIAWGIREAPQRGPARGLSHEQIISTAIEIASTQGLAAVTMQSVAKSLGFTTMSLYRYVSSKDELLRLMQDAALKVPEEVSFPDDWRQAIRSWAQLVRDAYSTHPWVLDIPRGPVSILMPNSVRAADMALAAMKDLPLSNDAKVGVMLVISQHIAATMELERDLIRQGDFTVSPEATAQVAEVITPERFPHLAPVIESGYYVATEDTQPGADVSAEYHLGLDLIINGLEKLVEESANASRADR